jgi:hypothetical protein
MPGTRPEKIEAVDEVVDPHLVEVDDYDPGVEPPGNEVTTTQNLQAGRHHNLQTHETVDAIVDLGVETLDPEAETHIVRVHTDVGPVFYGGTDYPIELQKNRRYRVPTFVYRYLWERGLLVDQLGEYAS